MFARLAADAEKAGVEAVAGAGVGAGLEAEVRAVGSRKRGAGDGTASWEQDCLTICWRCLLNCVLPLSRCQ